MENREGSGGEDLVKVGGAERGSRVRTAGLQGECSAGGCGEACELGGVWGREEVRRARTLKRVIGICDKEGARRPV